MRKPFRKSPFIKSSHRFFTHTAVSDIQIQVKSKRPPNGYSYIGEINNHSICIKFSQIPNNSGSGSNLTNKLSLGPPPIPPRPNSQVMTNQNDPFSSIEQDFVHVKISPSNEFANSNNNEFYNTNRSIQSNHSHTGFNPLQGVPFEINPVYDTFKANRFLTELIVSF